jgi:outer membrane receptor protein involved in Fe transport
VVYRASPSLSLALDGFYFNIDDAIYYLQTLNNTSLANACYANPGIAYCSFLQFNSAGQVNYLQTGYVNVAKIKTYGMDFEANWRTTLFKRPLNLRGLVTWQPHFLNTLPGLYTLEEAGAAVASGQEAVGAKVRATVTLSYKPTDRIGITLMERWRGKLNRTDRPEFYTQESKVPSVAYTNVNLSYSPKLAAGELELFLNVQNLFNTESPPSAFLGSAGAPGLFGGTAPGDDTIGRYYTAGTRFKF